MPHSRGTTYLQYYSGSGHFQKKNKTTTIFSESNQDPPGNDTQSGGPFEHTSFKLKSSFKPKGPFQLVSMFCSVEQNLHRQKYREPRKINLTKEKYKAIRSLRNNKDMVIKPADKGSAIAILDKLSYIHEGQKQLNSTQFYEQTGSDLTKEVIQRVNLHIHDMLQNGQISQNTCNYLTTDIERTKQLYLLPMIHKDPKNPSGKPTVSESGGPTEKITICGSFHRPLVPLSQSFIRESTHSINMINELTLQTGMLLCTLDITSLYTNTPHKEGIQSIKEIIAIHRTPNNLPHNSYIVEHLEVGPNI